MTFHNAQVFAPREDLRVVELSVCINTQIPASCGVPISEVVVGGIQECSGLSAHGHSYVQQNAASGVALLTLRNTVSSFGYNRLATDDVVTVGQPSAPAPMYTIQFGANNCNSPPANFWWFERECNAGGPVALPSLPLANVQPVDVAAIQ
jgi:hypothetical protein